jgi:hypothetical protein
MDEMVVKIRVEILSTLALATRELKQGRSSESQAGLADVFVTVLTATQSNL